MNGEGQLESPELTATPSEVSANRVEIRLIGPPRWAKTWECRSLVDSCAIPILRA
jgi:hypothetical protein